MPLNKLRAMLPKGRLAKGVSRIAGGTALGQLIIGLSTLVLARIYTPADFGILTVFISIISTLTLVSALRYEQAILLEPDDRDAMAVGALAFCCVVGTTATTTAVVLGLKLAGVGIFREGDLSRYWYLLPFGAAVYGTFLLVNLWTTRKQRYGTLAKIAVQQSSVSAGVQLGLGFLKVGSVGLLLGYIAYRLSGMGALVRQTWREDRAALVRPTFARLRELAKRYRKFPFFSMPAALFNSLGLNLPAIMLTSFFGATATGFFGMGQRLIGLPMMLLGVAVSQVYLGEAAKLRRTDHEGLRKLFRTTTLKLFKLALVVCVLSLPAPWLFGPVLGHRWTEAGWYVVLLAPAFMGQLVVAPISGTSTICERQDLQLVGDFLRVVIIAGAFYVAHLLRLPAREAIGLYSLLMVTTYAGFFFMYRAILDHDAPKPADPNPEVALA